MELYKGNTKMKLLMVFMPVFIGNLINIIYYLADTIWIGNMVGKDAIATTTIVYPIVILFSSIAAGIGNAITIHVSNAYGKNDKDYLYQFIKVSIIFSLLVGIVLVVLLEGFSNQMLILLKTPEEIFVDTKEYLQITLLSFFFVNLYYCISGILRGMGNTTLTMVLLMVSMVLNIVLDPIMINGYLFIPQLRVNGAAMATLISQGLVTIILILILLTNKKVYVMFRYIAPLNLFCKLGIKSILSIGQQIIPAVSLLFITTLISACGVSSVAAFGIIGKLDSIILLAAGSMNITLTTAFGQCYGAKEEKIAFLYLRNGVIVSLIITILSQVGIFAIMGSIGGIFGVGSEVVDLISDYFVYLILGYIFSDIACCIVGAINGMGNVAKATSIMAVGFLAIRVPLGYIMFHYFSLNGIWLSITISYFVMFLNSIILNYKTSNVIQEKQKTSVVGD